MAHGDAREGKWRGNWRMEWVASTLYTTSEHGVSSITTADAHTSAASTRLNWHPRRFKRTRPFRRKTKSGFCGCAFTFQTQSTGFPRVVGSGDEYRKLQRIHLVLSNCVTLISSFVISFQVINGQQAETKHSSVVVLCNHFVVTLLMCLWHTTPTGVMRSAQSTLSRNEKTFPLSLCKDNQTILSHICDSMRRVSCRTNSRLTRTHATPCSGGSDGPPKLECSDCVLQWFHTVLLLLKRLDRSRTMNTVGAATSTVGAYTRLCTVYIYCIHERKERLCQDHKINTLIL